ncbi:hypothetical protein RB593_003021 [Gaeumannomyces tritici]
MEADATGGVGRGVGGPGGSVVDKGGGETAPAPAPVPAPGTVGSAPSGGDTTMTTTAATTTTTPATMAMEQWTLFLSRCLATRLDPETFDSYVVLLYAKHPLPPRAVADVFLRPRPGNSDCLDPRIPPYLQILLAHQFVDALSILEAMYRYSTSHTQSRAGMPALEDGEDEKLTGGVNDAGGKNNGRRRQKQLPLVWGSSYAAEEHTFYRLTKSIAQGSGIRSVRDAIEIARVMARWMNLFTAAAAAFAADPMGPLQNSLPLQEMESARAGFVMLLLGLCESKLMLSSLSHVEAKVARKELSQSLANFVPSMVQSAAQIAARLEVFRTETLAGFEPVDKAIEAAQGEMNALLDSAVPPENLVLPEILISHTRAGLYIYVNSLLAGRPLMDDVAIFNHLHNRFQGNLQQMAIDLILASFDMIAHAATSRQPQRAAHVLRSYLTNKVPLLLVSLAASATPLYPLNAAACVEHAVRQVGSATFPNMSEYLVSSNRNGNTLTEGTREDFLFACCLHGLIPEARIVPILNEACINSLPPEGRLVKDNLVQECLADPEKTHQLVRNLDKCDGNVGAISQALVEVLGQLCDMKETMTLKTLCNQLARDPVYLDVLLLFDKLPTIVTPLCELLDNWRYDEDQGEFQPVYEEFGSVLLLLLAFIHRYNLTAADLGIRSADSFIAKLISRGHMALHLDELSEQEQSHLDKWIHGLFDSDAGGLGDELMSACPPQEFYLLIPTLFYNIVLAVSTGCLSEDSLKSGLEYLVDTFLLPALVPAIIYLCNHLWIDRSEEQKAIIRILQLIIAPSSISNEASTMLTSVLCMVAKPLDLALRTYQRQDVKNQDIDPLLRILKAQVPVSRRTGAADNNELDQWTGTPGGGINQAVRHTFRGLVSWSLAPPDPERTPTPYTHRQMLVALRLMRARGLLRLLLDEFRQQAVQGNEGVALDVCCALVCAPDSGAGEQPDEAAARQQHQQMNNMLDAAGGVVAPVPLPPQQQRLMSLRQALRYEAEDWKKIQRHDPAMAEAVVRLHRRVEEQMAVSDAAVAAAAAAATAAATAGMLQGGDINDMMAGDAAMAAAAAAVAAENTAGADGMSLDTSVGVGLDLGGGDLNLGGSSANSVGGLDGGLDLGDDMFRGLGPLDGLGGWDDVMDMS